ncbi:MAG TPA: uracil-DNA glycosylase [Fimbriimonadaceae bacterium]|nr:uracil-DNA glycosylase [Fimbriimonadaceae bacterium]
MDRLNEEIVACHACPRLVAWREQVAREKKKQFADWDYWGRPVPNFGDPDADRLIVGLAPAAHGANRTGRMFTGDRSGDWLYRALHKAGVASQPTSVAADDGLTLTGVLITATVHCAPPDNKPLPSEIQNCLGFFRRTLIHREWKAILCLGSIAWNQTLRALGEKSRSFGHGRVERVAGGIKLVASYHPSQQNTFTGKLTESMLDAAIAEFLD